MYFLFECNNNGILMFFNVFKNLIKLIQIVVPILLIISLVYTFIKMTSNPEEKKLGKRIINSFMALLFVFFIPLIVDATMKMVGEDTSLTSCWNNSNYANSKAQFIEIDESDKKKIISFENYEGGVKKDSSSTTSGGSSDNINVNTSASGSEKLDNAVKWAIQIANDNTYGYNNTYGYSNGQNKQYNCVCYVISALQYGGINVPLDGLSNVVELPSHLSKYGFVEVTNSVNFSNGNGLKKGDVVWTSYNSQHGHVELYIGDNKLAGARNDDDGKLGDGSGSEIAVSSYFNLPWKKVFRYNG